MGFVIGLLMVALGLAGIVIAVTGTQGQVWQTLTGHASSGTLLGASATVANATTTGPSASGTMLV
jgi:hypothetical protein